MELYKKHRPKTLNELVGNKDLISSLKEVIENDEVPQSILLTGPMGCGKTSIGRIIKDELKTNRHDYAELDTGVFNGIDTVREIRKNMSYKPLSSPYRIWLLDEVHQLGTGKEEKNKAQNALLKALEDTPEHVIFILCTTNPEMLIKTVRSRCVEFKVSTLSDSEMTILLKRVCKKEKTVLDMKVIKKIVENAEGHARNALQILERVYRVKDIKEQLKLAVAENYSGETPELYKLFKGLLNGENWTSVCCYLKTLKDIEPESIRRYLIGAANSVLLNGNKNASLILGWFLYKTTYDSGMGLITQFCYNIINEMEPPC